MGNPVVHFEVIGSDGAALERFYGELFGWHIQSVPDLKYGTVDTHGGEGINGGIGTFQEGSNYITFYAAVPDLQATLDKAEKLGGKTLEPPMEIPGVVTLAQFADPQGNRIGIIKAVEGEQAPGVSQGDGAPITWFEVLGPDPSALDKFYRELFGWSSKKNDGGGQYEYYEVDTQGGAGTNGGIGSSPDGNPHVTVYAEVEDVQKFLELAESLGGKTAMPPMNPTPDLTIGIVEDPQGNLFGLYTHQH
jgi:uncharacterized protein